MKRKIFLLFIVALSFLFIRDVYAKDTINISIKDIEVLEKNNIDVEGNLEFDGLKLKSNVTFYDVGDYIKYKVTLKNNDNKDYQIKDIIDDNSNSSMSYEYDGKDKIIKKNSEMSFTIKITYSEHITNDITKLNNNIYTNNKDVKISIQLANNTILNPPTVRNILLIVLVGVIMAVGINMSIKNKKIKTMIIILFLLLSTRVVKANEIITLDLTVKQPDKVKINFMDRNWKDIDSGADFTKIEFVDIDEDKSGAYDISEAKDRAIIEWVENGTLYIGSYHNVYAPIDSRWLFSINSCVSVCSGDEWTIQSSRIANVIEMKFNDRLLTNFVTNMSGMFGYAGRDVTTFSIIGLSNWNTSKVTDMSMMFAEAGEYATTWNIGDLFNWDVSNVTNMSEMFANAGYFATTWDIGDLSNWNVSNVTDMRVVFNGAGCDATTWSIGDLSNWNVSKVKNMDGMFGNTGSNDTTWSIGDLSNWDVSNVTNMSGMFGNTGSNATTWSIGDLSNWDVSNVTDMSGMFGNTGKNATTWNIGNLSNWDTSKVVNMSFMFQGAGENATTLVNIGTLHIYASNISYMFSYSPRANATLNIHNNPTNYSGVFKDAAIASGSGITVNYRSSVTDIDNIIATKSGNSNVFKGSIIS